MKVPSTKELLYRGALMRIAGHFSGCDILDDASAMYVLRQSCEALGVEIGKDEFGQVKLIWPDEKKPQEWPGDGRGLRRVDP